MGSFQGHCDTSGKGGHHFPFSVSSTRFSLSSSQCSSSVQRSPPTRSRTDCVQHIQGGCSASPHSSLRRVSVLSCSCPFCHFSLLGLSFSFPHAMASPESLCSESAERCMPASPRLTAQHTPLLPQHAESTDRHASRHVPLHALMGNLALYCGVIKRGCVHGGMGGPLFKLQLELYPVSKKIDLSRKKIFPAPAAALADPPWLSDQATSQAELWIVSSQI